MTIPELIERHEGWRSKPYTDTAGVLTIGVGRNLSNGLRDDEIELMLHNDIKTATITAMRFANGTWNALGEVRQAVLIDMAFNLGNRLFRFKRMQAAISELGQSPTAQKTNTPHLFGSWNDVAIEMRRSKWFTQVGHRGPELVQMWKSEEWPAGQPSRATRYERKAT